LTELLFLLAADEDIESRDVTRPSTTRSGIMAELESSLTAMDWLPRLSVSSALGSGPPLNKCDFNSNNNNNNLPPIGLPPPAPNGMQLGVPRTMGVGGLSNEPPGMLTLEGGPPGSGPPPPKGDAMIRQTLDG
jgi:hypothetical protein